VNDDFSQVSDFMLLNHLISGVVAWVPGGFVVNDDIDVAFFRGGFDGTGMFHVYRQRLLHHDVDVFRRAHFDDVTMFEGACKGRHGLDVGFREQIIQARIKEIRVEFESLCVSRDQIRLRFDNASELNAWDIVNAGNKAASVIVFQPDDREADR